MSNRVIAVTSGDSQLVRRIQSAQVELAPPNLRNLHHHAQLTGGERWYAVYTQPHREFRAQTQLSAQGFQTFLPRYRKTVRHARRLMTVSAPFFNRYLFVTLDLGRDQWRSVNGTFGVTSLVSDGMFPAPVPQGIVESLISMSDSNGFVRPGDGLRPGEQVRILTGPFAEQIGELVRLDGARRVRVLLHLLGGAVAVSMERDQLMSARAA
jgi:transcription elongation factor/antiterminator RfaH